jgi:hypothetical protein
MIQKSNHRNLSIRTLGRIRIDPVNPVYTYKVEQIHAVDGIADGDSINPDLL